MYRVTDAQTDYILNDIRQRGVEMEDLQNNLLDHICCMLEQKCKSEKDFETEYQNIIRQFFKHELWEIEEETVLLLKYKHYYKMKRFLYILLFLSVSYNIYMFSRMGYAYYKLNKWQSEWRIIEKSTLKDGFEDFKHKLYQELPQTPKTKFIYISYTGETWPPLMGNFDGYTSLDTSEIRIAKQRHLESLKRIDSIASIYNRNIVYVHAYSINSEKMDEVIKKNKQNSKNILFIKNVPMLLKGYENSKNQFGTYIPTTIILDSTGKVMFESTTSGNLPNRKLISFLKSIE